MEKLFFNLSKPAKTVLSGIAATTSMTAYSYLISEKKKKQFKEPKLLNYLVHGKQNIKIRKKRTGNHPATGFLLHYATGLVFSTAYEYAWKKKIHLSPLKSGLGFGLGIGLIGISIWKTVFTLHPNPPKIDLKSYLGHLIVAHLIFGLTESLTDQQLEK